MTGQTVNCPHCNTPFKLDESLAAPFIAATRKEYERRLAAKDAQMNAREEALKAQAEDLARKQTGLDEQVAAKVKAERDKIAVEEARKAKLLLGDQITEKTRELSDLRDVLKARDEKLAEAQKQQAELMRKQRELDDEKRELDITVEKRVAENVAAVREKAKIEAEATLRLKVTEKEEQISSMQRQIEELKRKAEQGSQQLQGEAQEIELESLLRSRFPNDAIEPVAKGEFGGDIVQKVHHLGQFCGAILWETKRTKNWTDSWLPKLRNDQRAAKADIALIMSNALPKGVSTFECVEGVWVTDTRCAMPVAAVLRQGLIDLATARRTADGQLTKAEMVYHYLTGPRFRQRIEAIVERYKNMREDLVRERTFMTKQWAKRETQLHLMMDSTVGMYGDLQGVAGSALAEIESLDVALLEAPLAMDAQR